MARNLEAFLTALYAKVKADAGFTAIVPADNIRSHLRQDEPYPCCRMWIRSAPEYDCKSINGFRLEIVCDIWSDYHGDKEILQATDAIIDALHERSLEVSTGNVVLLRYVRMINVPEPDGQVHRAAVIFDAIYREN